MKIRKLMEHKHLKAVIAVLFAVFLVSMNITNSVAVAGKIEVPNATDQFYVNDFANLFTDEQEQEMMQRAVSLAEDPEGVQVVLTTVDSLEGHSVEEYANTMYNKYEIGKEDRGVLILLSKGDRQIRVEVGYGLESYMTASKSGRFIDKYAMNYLRNNQFAEGLMALQKALVEDLDNHFDSARVTATTKATAAPVSNGEVTRSIPVRNDGDANKTSEVVVESKEPFGDNKVGIIIIQVGILVLGFAYAIFETIVAVKYKKMYEKSEAEYRESNDEWQRKYEALIEKKNKILSDLNQETSRKKDAEGKLSALAERFDRAKTIHPTLDAEIEAQIKKEIDDRNRAIAARYDTTFRHLEKTEPTAELAYSDTFTSAFSKYDGLSPEQKRYVTVDMRKLHDIHDRSVDLYNRKQAQKFDSRFKKLENVTPSAELAFSSQFQEAFNMYDALSPEQKRYVTVDMKKLHDIYDESADLYYRKQAEDYNERLEAACRGVTRGTESNLSTFKRFREEYSGMSAAQQYANATLIAQMDRFIKQGKKAREDRIAEEEEEKRRRRASSSSYHSSTSSFHSSSSSSFSHSSHSGFGGHSGGNGASRGF